MRSLVAAAATALAMAAATLRTPASAASGSAAAPAPPQVIFTVIIDDLGWNNVGWHQTDPTSLENQTPHLTSLAREGIILDQHRVHFTCTPSRSSYLTGRLPVHVQQTLANPDVQTAGIPRNMTALPWKLREAGYSTAVVGKWDMGFATPDHTPEGRGFQSSLVYAEHMNLYWGQKICPTGTACNMSKYGWLTDLWSNGGPALGLNNSDTYIETLFYARLVDLVNGHDMSKGPLYLQYNSHVLHWPLQVPQAWYDRYSFVQDDEDACGDDIPYVWPGANASVVACRRQFQAMLGLVDEVVGNITGLLKSKGWWDNTLMLLTADNGGSIAPSENAASNYPLRGGKYQPMEGGCRGAAFVSGGYLPPAMRNSTLEAPIAIGDWYGTLCGLAGVDPYDSKAAAAIPPLPPVDSIDVWPLLSGANTTWPRVELPVSPQVLIQWDQAGGHAYKLITGTIGQSAGWQGPVYPNTTSPRQDPFAVSLECGSGCLFDVHPSRDPTEHVDLAASDPARVAAMTARLQDLSKGFYSNSDVGVPLCPANVTGDCMCWRAANVWQGYLGPWQA